MLTLYYAAGTCALASHIALELAGADYAVARVDFSRNEQRSADFLKLNPKGRVPALQTSQGMLTETPALLQYIAQTHPAAGLLPPADDLFALAQVNAFNSYLCSTVHVAHAHGRRGYRWSDDAAAQASMKQKVAQTMGDCFALIESELLQGPWVMGERFSICDPYLFTLSQWLAGDGVDITRFAKVAGHAQRMTALPAVQSVLAAEQAAA